MDAQPRTMPQYLKLGSEVMSGFARGRRGRRQTRRALRVQEVTCTSQENKRKAVGCITGDMTVSLHTL